MPGGCRGDGSGPSGSPGSLLRAPTKGVDPRCPEPSQPITQPHGNQHAIMPTSDPISTTATTGNDASHLGDDSGGNEDEALRA